MSGPHAPLPLQRRPSRLALLLAALAVLPAAVRAAGPEMSLTQYRSRLQSCRSGAASLLRGTAAPGRAAQARLLQVLPLEAEVRMPDGVAVSVGNHALGQSLSSALARPDLPGRRARLRQFVATMDRLLSATEPPSGEFRAATSRAAADTVLQSVLSRPEFQTKEPGRGWEERFILWLDRLLRRLFSGTPVATTGSDWPARLVLAAVVLLLAILLARVVLLVLPNLRRRSRPEPELPVGELLVPSEPDLLLSAAEREAAAGRYREALRLAFQALVVRLDRAGVLPEDRSRTHWELLRDLRRAGRDPLYRELAPITRRVDERLFGGRTATVDDYQACRSVYTHLETLLCAPA
jgi:hypothetical protein